MNTTIHGLTVPETPTFADVLLTPYTPTKSKVAVLGFQTIGDYTYFLHEVPEKVRDHFKPKSSDQKLYQVSELTTGCLASGKDAWLSREGAWEEALRRIEMHGDRVGERITGALALVQEAGVKGSFYGAGE